MSRHHWLVYSPPMVLMLLAILTVFEVRGVVLQVTGLVALAVSVWAMAHELRESR